ncbi:hypothetical protein E2C01_056358 [Portunus trituberculatus]|uniref:Uncharacterized protein n=1 Tax=Portunus trituberculatus TaxID=210409 RepID=A0A5B7GXH3_PORTR|nr:hypothetical protein [Portunus trituberculatus]
MWRVIHGVLRIREELRGEGVNCTMRDDQDPPPRPLTTPLAHPVPSRPQPGAIITTQAPPSPPPRRCHKASITNATTESQCLNSIAGRLTFVSRCRCRREPATLSPASQPPSHQDERQHHWYAPLSPRPCLSLTIPPKDDLKPSGGAITELRVYARRCDPLKALTSSPARTRMKIM